MTTSTTNPRSSRWRLSVYLLLIFALNSAPALAELPPGSYEKLRDEAQEAITAKVLSVESKEVVAGKTEVVAKLEVTAVERTKSGLKEGDKLTVKYIHLDPKKLPGFVGPRPIPILEEDKTYPAFLDKPDNQEDYAPAAYGASFTERP